MGAMNIERRIGAPLQWLRSGDVQAAWKFRGLWLGPLAWLLALFGTLQLADAGSRLESVVTICLGAVLAIAAWGWGGGPSAFRSTAENGSISSVSREKSWRIYGIVASVSAALAADLRFARNPLETFGVAGVLWLVGIASLIAATMPRAVWGSGEKSVEVPGRVDAWWRIARQDVEGLAVISLIALALFLRTYDLAGIPFAIHPDEIITGRVTVQAFGGPAKVSVFSTIWSLINLPALWFTAIAGSLFLFGHTLAALRLPVALVGTATIVPFYAMVRQSWGPMTAMMGTFLLAASAVDVHFSRVTINNLTTPFFWAACFFFLLRGVSNRRAIDWSLAGILAGLSEYTFYGTRLLVPVLGAFCAYLVVFHRRRDRQSLIQYGLLVVGYLVAFGPLLVFYIQNQTIYLGRGQSELIWQHLPRTGGDVFAMAGSLWLPVARNLLSISTFSDEGSFYWSPLLMPAEAALLVMGAALLVWRWRSPPEFLMLLSGLATLIVGGTLVLGAPAFQHWTPAFPAIYAAIALPLGALGQSVLAALRGMKRNLALLGITLAVCTLGCKDMYFYFHEYQTTRPEFEIRAAQSRWETGLGLRYSVFTVGKTWQPYDAETNSYLIQGQRGGTLLHPRTELPTLHTLGTGLGFLFMPDEQKYIPLVRRLYPAGVFGEVRSHTGVHLFYTYVVSPARRSASWQTSRRSARSA